MGRMCINYLKKKNFSNLSRRLDKRDIKKENELNVDINKDLDILSEKVNKFVSLKEEISPIYKKFFDTKKDVLESAEKFLSKHNISKNLTLGKLRTYLNSQMDLITLMDILGSKGSKEEIITLFRKIKSDCNIDINLFSAIASNSQLFDYLSIKEHNERIMDSYSNIIKDIDSIEFNSDSIDMSHLGCLIGPKLYDLLENSFRYKQTCKPGKTDANSFYVVVFNILKSKENDKVRYDLIYNYTQYNKIFLVLFYVYVSIQQSSILIHNNLNIGSSYFFCMDSKLKEDIRNAFDFDFDILKN